MAQYPTSAPTFTTKADTVDDVQAAHMNAVQDEITAIGTQLLTGWTSYTPAWTAATTNPEIGDGSRGGRYAKVGKVVFFESYLTIGTSTPLGTGIWYLSLPSTTAYGLGYG